MPCFVLGVDRAEPPSASLAMRCRRGVTTMSRDSETIRKHGLIPPFRLELMRPRRTTEDEKVDLGGKSFVFSTSFGSFQSRTSGRPVVVTQKSVRSHCPMVIWGVEVRRRQFPAEQLEGWQQWERCRLVERGSYCAEPEAWRSLSINFRAACLPSSHSQCVSDSCPLDPNPGI
jgi:hypothetical protein